MTVMPLTAKHHQTGADSTPTGLPRRLGPAPRTTAATPHLQLDQPAPDSLQAELWRRMRSLAGVQPGRSLISAPSSRALHLDPSLAHGPREAFLVETEFAHLHGDGSGSLHAALPEPLRSEAISKGWAAAHPAAGLGIAPATLVMIFGPRTHEELAIVWRLVEASYAHARGMSSSSPARAVLSEVTSWPGVSIRSTPRGATRIILEGHELGHVHPDRETLDLPRPDERRAEVLAAARANEWFAGWVSKPLRRDADARDAIALLRESYDELSGGRR